MSPYRKLAHSHRRMSRVNLWMLVPLCVVNVALNAAIALDQPIRWVVVGMWLLTAVLFALAGRSNGRAARSYEAAGTAWEESEELWARVRGSLVDLTETYEGRKETGR